MSNAAQKLCVSYEAPQAVLDKVAWVKAQGFGGIFCWEWSQDSAASDLANAMLT
jgi:GH18 family chitinase